MKCLPAAVCLAVMVIGTSADVAAATIARDTFTHGAASCQAALPVFDGNIRKRPLAIANEGSGTAFVTCGTDDMVVNVSAFNFAQIQFTNRNGGAVTVNCTLVDGLVTPFASIPKSISVAGNQSGTVTWGSEDNGGNSYAYLSMSCALPPRVEITYVRFSYNEEIGS